MAEAQRQIGELLYTKLERYEKAVEHYQGLLKKNPTGPDSAFFKYRIAKSDFFLWKFNDAIEAYQTLIREHPGSRYSEKARFEVGVTYFTQGEKGQEKGAQAFQQAIEAYQQFIKLFPKSELVPQARFGVASCFEEMGQLDAAYHAYEELQSSYPAPKVIQIKLARIRERRAQRNH